MARSSSTPRRLLADRIAAQDELGLEPLAGRGEARRGIPDDALERVQPALRQVLGSLEDVAAAVLFAVTHPIHVTVADIAVRPVKALNL